MHLKKSIINFIKYISYNFMKYISYNYEVIASIAFFKIQFDLFKTKWHFFFLWYIKKTIALKYQVNWTIRVDQMTVILSIVHPHLKRQNSTHASVECSEHGEIGCDSAA